MDGKCGDKKEDSTCAGHHQCQQMQRNALRQQAGLEPDRRKGKRRNAVADQSDID
jgi:hypothetical protein